MAKKQKKTEPIRRITCVEDITMQDRADAERCAAAGMEDIDAAQYIGVNVGDFRRWLIWEYKTGRVKAIGTVGSRVYQMAIGNPAKGIDPNIKAAEMWLKRVAGWQDKLQVEIKNDSESDNIAELIEKRMARLAERSQARADK